MANTRVFLKNIYTEQTFCLGKYYASQGWYLNPHLDLDTLDEFMNEPGDHSINGDCPWIIEYD